MPWLETSPMDQRKQFITEYLRGLQSVTELAERFAISRKTAYKWIDRHEREGTPGLADRSRRRSPSGQSQQRHPLEPSLGLCHAHARRRVRRSRRNRRWDLGCILRPAETRTNGRTDSAH